MRDGRSQEQACIHEETAMSTSGPRPASQSSGPCNRFIGGDKCSSNNKKNKNNRNSNSSKAP